MDNYMYLNNYLSHKLLKLDKEELKKSLPIRSITSNKVIAISDTHFGSTYENYNYIDLVYDYAIKNNIKVILHAGDFFQGTPKPLKKEAVDLKNQINLVINNYPYSKEIINYILLGNHDYFLIKKDLNLYDITTKRNDLDILGLRKVYLNFNNTIISMSHHIDNVGESIPRVETLIRLCGHRHELMIDNSSIYLPTLSDDIKYYGYNNNYPGFLVLYLDNKLYVEHNIIDNNNVTSKKLILERNISERVKI